MIRFAAIASNAAMDRFLEGIKACEEMECTAVYARTAEERTVLARKYHFEKIYDHPEDLAMDETIDAVYIASPPARHFGQIMMMLNYGKHVLCERPAVSNAKELELVLQAAEENEVLFFEAVKTLCTPGLRRIRELFPKIGKARNALIRNCEYSFEYERFQRGMTDAAFSLKLSEGAIMDAGCEAIHFMIALFGMPKSFTTDGKLLPGGCDGSGAIHAEYQDMQVQVLYSKTDADKRPSRIQGEAGCMLIPDISCIREIGIVDCEGHEELYAVSEEDRGNTGDSLIYAISEFRYLIEEEEMAHSYYQNMTAVFRMMDEVRRRIGIVFPADKIMEVL